MLTILAIDTSPKWLLILYVCSGDPQLSKDPEKDINCKRIEQPTFSLLHCQNEETLAPTRIGEPYYIKKSKCVEITKQNNPNIG
jgi:hypothetical protein|tara:strand:+ start:205 stop:456 length:252 start_codon:yes stop_codon:yes gene_type:complete